MLTREEYIRLSIELNLSLLNSFMEHSIFIETSFTAKTQTQRLIILRFNLKC